MRRNRLPALPLRALLGAALAAAAPSSFAETEPSRNAVYARMFRDMPPSTATAGFTSLHLPGSHLREDTARYSIEADIAPPLPLLKGVAGGPWPGTYMLVTVPRFLVRRLDALPSNPVRTPGFLPSVTLHYAPASGDGEAPLRYLSLTLLHHSNGEEGEALNDDSSFNTVNGSFGIWSLSATLHLRDPWPWLPEYKSVRIERIIFKEFLIRNLYPDWVVSLNLGTAEKPWTGPGFLRGRVRLLAGLDWRPRVAGPMPDSLKPVPFSGVLTGVFAPERRPKARAKQGAETFARPEFALFARAYAGHDYYNILFNREVFRIDAGILVGPATFLPF